METPPPSPQGSPLQVTPLAIQAPNPDCPPLQTSPSPTQPSTYKRKIRSKKTCPIASAPPPTKQKESPATPTSKPPPKSPRTATSKEKGSSASASHPQAKFPPSSKKKPFVATSKDRKVQLTRYISEDALKSVGLFDSVVAYLDGLDWMDFEHK
ncbi:alpha carbonic anhydrase 8-like [Hevea brasiliensis]|uniref:alpha carbonic anhydrase 8-like n=1 Tax=Hevea brasiliensis TaxID=3981 RepID=UPI0025CC4E7D|nr:alpha carbonic anhydrase 8-like [Hevea brasiliensis]